MMNAATMPNLWELELDQLAREYKKYSKAIKDYETEKEGLKDRIKAIMDAQKVDKLQTMNGHNISYTAIEKSYLDSKLLKQNEPDIVADYTFKRIEARLDVR